MRAAAAAGQLQPAHALAASLSRGLVWISPPASNCRVRSITKLVTTVMVAAGVKETAHGLRYARHTPGPRARPRPHPVADVLGHADVKTTRRYARTELKDRRAALEALDR